jgi:hypothetical protein
MDEQTRNYAQSNLTLPHDIVPLPSEGVFYKNKKKSVKVGYLTAADENILMAVNADTTTTLLRNKLYEPDMRIDDLLEGDVEAILIFLRNTGFGPEVNMNLVDPQTKKSFQATIAIDQLSITKGQTPSEDGTFTTRLPKSGSTIKLRPITYGEINEIQKTIEAYPQGRVAPKVTLRLTKEIAEVDGTTDKSEIAKFVEQMPIMDSKYIRKFMDENEPRLDMKKEVIAPSGERLTVNVGFGVEFFRPFFGL